jgi:hypothetical protein
MIQGTIVIQGVAYKTVAATTTDGRALKILAFKDVTSGIEIHIPFLPEEFDVFIQKIQGSPLAIARDMPKLLTPL